MKCDETKYVKSKAQINEYLFTRNTNITFKIFITLSSRSNVSVISSAGREYISSLSLILVSICYTPCHFIEFSSSLIILFYFGGKCQGGKLG